MADGPGSGGGQVEGPLTAGDLIEMLKEVPADTPVHSRGSLNEFPPMTRTVAKAMLMRSRDDPSYIAWEGDEFWSSRKDGFEEPFEAVVFY